MSLNPETEHCLYSLNPTARTFPYFVSPTVWLLPADIAMIFSQSSTLH